MPFAYLTEETTSFVPSFHSVSAPLRAEDLRDAACNILGSHDEAQSLDLIRQAVNWSHAGLDGDYFPELRWEDDLLLRDKAALIWIMYALARGEI